MLSSRRKACDVDGKPVLMNALMCSLKEVNLLSYTRLIGGYAGGVPLEDSDIPEHDIYFITVAKRARFNLENCYVSGSWILNTQLKLGEELSRPLSMAMYEEWRPMTDYFPSLEEFRRVVSALYVNAALSNEYQLTIRIRLRSGEKYDHREIFEIGKTLDIPICIDDYMLDLESGGLPELKYIGQRFKAGDRNVPDSPLNKVLSTLRPDEEIRINLFCCECSLIECGQRTKDTDLSASDFVADVPGQSVHTDSFVSLVLTTLNHYYKPVFNSVVAVAPLQEQTEPEIGSPDLCAVIIHTGSGDYQRAYWTHTSDTATAVPGSHFISCDLLISNDDVRSGIDPKLNSVLPAATRKLLAPEPTDVSQILHRPRYLRGIPLVWQQITRYFENMKR